ncbi:hypothetical protein ACFLWC_00380 [Chloroflexota bacterium]
MKKKRPEKKQLTDEEKSRAADAKLKRFIAKSALELADRNPEVKRQMVSQTFNYKLPDEAEKSQQELVAHIDRLAIKMLEEDPKFARVVAEARIRQVTEDMGLQIEGEEWRRKPRTIDDEIEFARKIKQLKEVLGIKEPGILDAFKDPKVIVSALQVASELLGKKMAPTSESVVISVSPNGEERIMTPEDYEKLKAQGHVKHLSDVKAGEPIHLGKGHDTAYGPETSNKANEEPGKTDAASPDK